jgi:hypothetical protein
MRVDLGGTKLQIGYWEANPASLSLRNMNTGPDDSVATGRSVPSYALRVETGTSSFLILQNMHVIFHGTGRSAPSGAQVRSTLHKKSGSRITMHEWTKAKVGPSKGHTAVCTMTPRAMLAV